MATNMDNAVKQKVRGIIRREVEMEEKEKSDYFKEIKHGCYSLGDLAPYLTEYGEPGQMKELEGILQDYFSLEKTVKCYMKALGDLNGCQFDGPMENIKAFITSQTKQYLDADSEDYKDSKMYRDFAKVAGLVPEDPDRDVMVQESNSTMSTKCIITQCPMEEPLISTICGHTFSRQGVMYLLNNRQTAKCPVGGCASHISMEIMERDTEMELHIERSQLRGQAKHVTQPLETVSDEDDSELIM